jgi:hypothetical protein
MAGEQFVKAEREIADFIFILWFFSTEGKAANTKVA